MKSVSGARSCRALERKGWTRVKTKSGHRKYRSPDGRRTVIVPVHGGTTLKSSLQAALMKQSGLRDDDLGSFRGISVAEPFSGTSGGPDNFPRPSC
jgi:predicted RNA binding protein YcfA (HicA-like mRNA interferase family)